MVARGPVRTNFRDFGTNSSAISALLGPNLGSKALANVHGQVVVDGAIPRALFVRPGHNQGLGQVVVDGDIVKAIARTIARATALAMAITMATAMARAMARAMAPSTTSWWLICCDGG